YYPEDTENPLDFDYQGKIVDFPKDKLLYGTRDEAIVDFGKNLKAVPGQDYGVYRVYHKVFHPDSKEILGVLIKKVGRIRLTDDVQEYTAQGVILSAFSPLEKGDMVRRIEP
ncbi:MAG TPA: hypothetical protein VJC03_02550, partial [bacterium]|nr:hypothetical protein [bacterium]